MKFKTIQASAFKAVFEVLKDIINDVNMYFNKSGVHIVALDTARVTLVHMNMAAENFEEYECDDQIIAGMNMANMFKLLKSVASTDTLTMSITGRDFIDIKVENTAKKTFTNFKLKLLDINEETIQPPEIDMDIITTLPSIDFQKITRDMHNLSNEINILRKGNRLEFSCKGDIADQETVYEYPETAPETGATFSLKYINLFTKATSMGSSVQLLQSSENSELIVFRYTIANLGDLKFYLAANIDDN